MSNILARINRVCGDELHNKLQYKLRKTNSFTRRIIHHKKVNKNGLPYKQCWGSLISFKHL